MPFIFRTIAAIGTVMLLGETVSARSGTFRLPTPSDLVQQHPDRSLPQQQRGEPPFSLPTQRLSQVGNSPNLSLLAKVIVGFLKGDDYQTQSKMHVNAVIGTSTVTADAQIQTTSQFPNKFRTEISFAKPGEPTQVKTLIVSDGTRVWVYRVDLKQYAVFTYEKFDQLEDSYWIGFATTMFAQTPPEAKAAVAKSTLSDPDLLQTMGLELNALKGGPRTVESENFYAYEYKDTQQGFLLSAFVEPESAILKRLQITGKYEDSDITMVERLLSRTAIAPVNIKTFTFTPPKGTKKVKTLALGPL
ncbi:hypothetical protein [Stenomitos frigidus]|uniref:Uncharacterized protein n=1 Tax=Stenomitos frigidus ULC18 TaxID=2107698 RepID=A0A2T1EHG6_9CYAN|nr:hypothetical protein [Stenomitos frigidus]PSB32179.1 hypothetical protein C7B82_05930 [Stenomitos frigidus ULC18]